MTLRDKNHVSRPSSNMNYFMSPKFEVTDEIMRRLLNSRRNRKYGEDGVYDAEEGLMMINERPDSKWEPIMKKNKKGMGDLS